MFITIRPDLFLVRAIWTEVVNSDIRLRMMRMVVIVIIIIAIPGRGVVWVARVAREAIAVPPGAALVVTMIMMIRHPAFVAAVIVRAAVGLAVSRRTVVMMAVLVPWRAFLPALVATLVLGPAVRFAVILVIIVILVFPVAVAVVPVNPAMPAIPVIFVTSIVLVAVLVLVVALIIALVFMPFATTPVIVPIVTVPVACLIEGVTRVPGFVVLLVAGLGVGILVAGIVEDLGQRIGGQIRKEIPSGQGHIGREAIAVISSSDL